MMLSNPIKTAIGITLVSILALAGCAKAAPVPVPTPAPALSPAPKPTPTPKPAQAPTPTGPYGELRIATSTLGAHKFDPIRNDWTGQGMNLYHLYDPLFWAEKGEDRPMLAERWEVSQDGLTWTFYIRKGVKFHNGDDLTAADVKFSIDRHRGPGSLQPSEVMLDIERTEVVDDYTIRIYTKTVQPFFRHNLSQGTATALITPKRYMEQRGVDYFEIHPVGSGPYRFANAIFGDVSQYEAVDNHWARQAAFKKLSVILVPEETTKAAMLRTGGVDIIDVSFETAESLEALGFKTRAHLMQAGIVWFHGAYESRGKGKPTQDIRVRKALSLAIKRQDFIDVLYKGKAQRPLPHTLCESNTDMDTAYWYDYYAKANPYDPAEAKRLLKEAGYPDGFKMKFYCAKGAGRGFIPAWTEVIQGYWREIGVIAELNEIDVGTYTMWRRHPVNLNFVGNAMMYGYPEFPGASAALHLGQYDSEVGGTRMLDEANLPALDKLLRAMKMEMDAAKRREMVAQAIKITTDTYTALQIARVPQMIVYGPQVSLDDWPVPPANSYHPTYAYATKHAK